MLARRTGGDGAGAAHRRRAREDQPRDRALPRRAAARSAAVPRRPGSAGAAVEEAERWGDEVFQMAARRLALAAAITAGDALIEPRRATAGWGRCCSAARPCGASGVDVIRPLRVHRRRGRRGGAAGATARACSTRRRLDRGRDAQRRAAQRRRLHDRAEPRAALLLADLRPELSGRPLIALLDRVLPEPRPSSPTVDRSSSAPGPSVTRRPSRMCRTRSARAATAAS